MVVLAFVPSDKRRYVIALVLCTGVDKALLQSRRYVLESAGHTVVTVTDETTLLGVYQKHSFDVAVIGQGTGGKMKRHIASLVREHCPDAKLLELHAPYEGRSVQDADSWLETPVDAPKELADRVDELVKSNGNKTNKGEKEGQ